jgi:hypothetical protein
VNAVTHDKSDYASVLPYFEWRFFMSPLRAKDVKFSSVDQANQTLVLDLGATAAIKRPLVDGQEPTMVLDLTATQVRNLLDTPDAKG